MSRDQAQIEIRIDIFDHENQRAIVQGHITPLDLITAILTEFSEIEYLGANPLDYELCKADCDAPLRDNEAISDQVNPECRLKLVEREAPLPTGARRPSHPVYLREQTSGITYRLQWLPAIVGRCSESLPQNELIAVDLGVYPTGLRVSRRHVMITEEEGKYYAQSLSANPISLVRLDGREQVPLAEARQRLYCGDLLQLERSDLKLKFVVRDATLHSDTG